MNTAFTAAQVAEQVQGEVVGDGSIQLTGLAGIDAARSGDLTFAEKASYLAAAEQGLATAVLVPRDCSSSTKVLIRVTSPRIAMATLLPLFFAEDAAPPGIHPTAVVEPSATIDPTAHVGPLCVIGAQVRIGARCCLFGGNHVRHDSRLGDDVVLHPNVVIYPKTHIGNRVIIHAGTVIGSDGYGYVFDEGRHRKLLQVGHVSIQDDVEIGANTAIDRGALGPTVIGQGSKIDNLVHVAHNVSLGRHCLAMGQCGFAGSTTIGDYSVIASQSGIAGHLTLGAQSTVGAKSGVMRDIPSKGVVLGIPAQPDQQTKRQWIALQQLPELIRRVRALESEREEPGTPIPDQPVPVG